LMLTSVGPCSFMMRGKSFENASKSSKSNAAR
jgi:hypothetical protein